VCSLGAVLTHLAPLRLPPFAYTTLFRARQHQRAGGDRPGLVGHDAAHAADVLHRHRTAHQGLAARQAKDADAEKEGVDDRKLLRDRKSTRLNSSHVKISYAVFCLKKKTT